jgi:hypothetical protein
VLLVAVAVCCVLAPSLMQLGVESPLRTVSVVVLFLIAPGVALLPVISGRPLGHELALVFAASLAVTVLIAQSMLWLGAWSTTGATWVLAILSLLSVGVQLALRRAAARPRESRASGEV